MSFTVLPGDPNSPVVVHVPHASRRIPDEVRAGIELSDDDLAAELDAMTDGHTDVIAAAIAERLAALPWTMLNRTSRLVVDPERFPDPAAEEMTAVGMGAVYTRTSDSRVLRRPSPAERHRLLETFFVPSAAAMTALVDDRLAETGAALVVDVHSFPRVALPYELHADARRPALCVGVDRFHTPPRLAADLLRLVDDAAVDEPFAGCYVPLAHHGRDARVAAVMLEFRRDTYLTAQSDGNRADGERADGVDPVWLDAIAGPLARVIDAHLQRD